MKTVVKVKANESDWMREVRFMGDVVQVTKLARRKNSRNTRVTHFWYTTQEAWEAFVKAVANMQEGDSYGRIFNAIFQPIQGTEEARAAIEAAKASN